MQGNLEAYLVCMPEPCCAFLLATDQRDPFTATPAEAFPYIEVALGAASLLWPLECSTRRCAHSVRERLVVPKGAILKHEPAPWLTQSAPALSLVAVSAYPTWGIQIPGKTQILLVWNKIRI